MFCSTTAGEAVLAHSIQKPTFRRLLNNGGQLVLRTSFLSLFHRAVAQHKPPLCGTKPCRTLNGSCPINCSSSCLTCFLGTQKEVEQLTENKCNLWDRAELLDVVSSHTKKRKIKDSLKGEAHEFNSYSTSKQFVHECKHLFS